VKFSLNLKNINSKTITKIGIVAKILATVNRLVFKTPYDKNITEAPYPKNPKNI
jgi:hypothetical protein